MDSPRVSVTSGSWKGRSGKAVVGADSPVGQRNLNISPYYRSVDGQMSSQYHSEVRVARKDQKYPVPSPVE